MISIAGRFLKRCPTAEDWAALEAFMEANEIPYPEYRVRGNRATGGFYAVDRDDRPVTGIRHQFSAPANEEAKKARWAALWWWATQMEAP
jgi:hypothetical protein